MSSRLNCLCFSLGCFHSERRKAMEKGRFKERAAVALQVDVCVCLDVYTNSGELMRRSCLHLTRGPRQRYTVALSSLELVQMGGGGGGRRVGIVIEVKFPNFLCWSFGFYIVICSAEVQYSTYV